ncbi:MAG: hypothetical protein QOH00_963, partial [Gaiellales bacterium]|nr:hypothetical protein [Gaiellales bacterium]
MRRLLASVSLIAAVLLVPVASAQAVDSPTGVTDSYTPAADPAQAQLSVSFTPAADPTLSYEVRMCQTS